MRIHFLLLLLSCSLICRAQDARNLKDRNLHGKVKTVKQIYNDSKSDYTIDSFDKYGGIAKTKFFSVRYRNSDQADTIIEKDSVIMLYTYDNQHHLLKRTYNHTTESSDSSEYTYNSKGQLIKLITYKYYGQIINTYEYNNNGKVIKELMVEQVNSKRNLPRQQTLTFEYNRNNQLIEVNTSTDYRDSTESVNVPYNLYEYFGTVHEGYFAGKALLKYNTKGYLIGQDLFDSKGRPNGKFACRYDSNNNIIYRSGFVNKHPYTNSYSYKYDAQNNWIEKKITKDLVVTRIITYY